MEKISVIQRKEDQALSLAKPSLSAVISSVRSLDFRQLLIL